MRNRALAVFCLLFLSPALCAAENEGGFTSSEGALPLGAGGKTSLWLLESATAGVTGNVGVGTSQPQANLEVRGGVKIGTDEAFLTDPSSCAGLSKKGTLSYADGKLYFCDGTLWSVIGAQ